MTKILYCEEKKNASKHFIKKFVAYTNHRYRIATKWITRKAKSLFKVKSKNPHPSYVIKRGKCLCGEEYIGETERNMEKRWSEHNNPIEKTKAARHLSNNISHLFAWEVLIPGSKDKRIHKNLEAFFYCSSKTIIE